MHVVTQSSNLVHGEGFSRLLWGKVKHIRMVCSSIELTAFAGTAGAFCAWFDAGKKRGDFKRDLFFYLALVYRPIYRRERVHYLGGCA